VQKQWLVGLAIVSSVAGFACKSTTRSDDAGSVSVALQLANGSVLNSVAYSITGPSSFLKTGTIDVSSSSAISAIVSPIPAGVGYTVTLTGNTTDGAASCAGSGNFDVVAHQVATVAVHMICQQPPRNGSVLVNGTLNVCPLIDGAGASPSEVLVGGSIGVSAQAHDADNGPSPLTYHWTASSGALTDPSALNTRFTCTTAGPATLTLSVSDGDPSAACADTTSITVNCTAASGANACKLGGGAIKHVIYIQFDNTHLTRDRAAVPSDLEQMPHLLNFIRGNGTMMANDHTILISHTAGGILSTLTGVYPDRNGQTVTNSYVRTSNTGSFSFPSSFTYWTDPTQSGTTVPNMVGPDGSNIPAPWVPFTRAGCDVGGVAGENIVLENTGTGANGDVTTIFGTGSPQFAEATASNSAASGTAARQLAQTNLVGFSVHCALGSPNCASGESDLLPSEPGGYTGYKALFGAEQINPLLTGQPFPSALNDLAGQPIVDPFGQPGFPNFDGMYAATSLAYIAAMQEHGIPVTFAYISDAHDNHGLEGNNHIAYGPGSAGYVQQLAAYDAAFAAFFTRLASDGIDKTNTLFIFTVDEGDHFVGGTPTPANCDGVNVPCDWTTNNQVGELQANIDTLVTNQFPTLASQFLGSSAPNTFTVHGDDAPTFYLAKKGTGGGSLGQTDPGTRSFEQQIANLTAVNSFTGNTDRLLYRMADQTGMKAFHMFTTGDPIRNPQFVFFGDADYFITDFPSSTCLTCIGNAYAWNHGDDQPEIAQTWMGLVGPGVKNQPDQTVFTDHVDVRPTIMALTGIRDSYQGDGRVITQALQPGAYPASLGTNVSLAESLGDAYKKINAPFGAFAQAMLDVSTCALPADNTTYASLEASIAGLVTTRDALAVQIRSALDQAQFAGVPLDATTANNWIMQAQTLLGQAAALDTGCASLGTGGAGGSGTGGATGTGGMTATGGTTGTAGATGSAGTTGAGGMAATGGSTGTAGTTGAAGSPGTGGTPATGGTTGTGGTPATGGTTGTGGSGGALADLVIYRVGDGTAALSSAGTAVFLDEFTPAGVLVRSTEMPTTTNGTTQTHRLVASGSATSEGLITRSVDGHYITLTGYDTALGTASVAGTASTSVPRVIGRMDAMQNVDTTTGLTDVASANNPRSAIATDSMDFWITGANGGIHYAPLGASTSTTVSTTVANLRQVEIFAGQLFVSTSSGSAVRIGPVGMGIPTTTGQTTANLPGFETAGSPYAFYMADLDAGTAGLDTMYVADDGAGLQKFSLVGGVWVSNGTIGSATDLYRGVTGVASGNTVTLFAIRSAGQLVTLVDSSGYNGTIGGTPTVLATAATNTAYRGVAFAPF
jgi:hypothetical protein